MHGFYTDKELQALLEIKNTERDIESRMPVKITRHYFEQAKNSKSMQKLIQASPDETYDLAGSNDPGKQMNYSPVEGLAVGATYASEAKMQIAKAEKPAGQLQN